MTGQKLTSHEVRDSSRLSEHLLTKQVVNLLNPDGDCGCRGDIPFLEQSVEQAGHAWHLPRISNVGTAGTSCARC